MGRLRHNGLRHRWQGLGSGNRVRSDHWLNLGAKDKRLWLKH